MKWYTVMPAILITLLLVYTGYLIWLYAHQRDILFPGTKIRISARPVSSRYSIQPVALPAAGEICEMWIIPPVSDRLPGPCVIFAHGNGEVMDDCVTSVLPFLDMNFSVALIEYPGYGRCTGQPSEQSIIDLFCCAYDTLVQMPGIDPEQILGYGRSLGAAAVCALSRHRQLAGMILQSPFISVTEMAKSRWVPGFVVREKFDNQAAVKAYQGPILLFHGTEDPMIPFSHSEALLGNAVNGQLIPLMCGHNDCPPDLKKFWEYIAIFVRDNGWEQRG